MTTTDYILLAVTAALVAYSALRSRAKTNQMVYFCRVRRSLFAETQRRVSCFRKKRLPCSRTR